MSISRRAALQALATAAATAAVPSPLRAARTRHIETNTKASILYDGTRCIGCRECIVGCSEAHGWSEESSLGESPALTDEARTAILRFVTDKGDAFRKTQCMHCLDPACVSACMLGAMHKDEDGAVQWNGDLCVGCRYCQIACPYVVPRFEWDTPVPSLTKCDLCSERRAEGLQPGCVDACRMGALVFGTREEMLAEAHRRIEADPGKYNPKVFGETDGGGTSVLYLTRPDVSYAQLGLPDLGDRSVPHLPETIQHTIYKGFAAPLALFAVLGAVVRRNTKKLKEEESAHHEVEHSAAVGGKLITTTTVILAALTLLGAFTVLWRFVVGLGASTNMNDGYAFGLWITMDVVVGTALACGGYAMALLVYVANRGKYHPLVRPALLTSAFGYTLGGISVLVDLGRFWNFYRIPTHFWAWNFNSILLEVALCIMLYTTVLWIEVSPAVLEGWQGSKYAWLRKISMAVLPKLEKALPYFIALGLLLPTMHQSSLGSMMLLSGHKLHPLWHSPLLPLLFLVSVVGMGYAAVTLEATISAKAFKRPQETPMLRALAVPVAGVLLAYAALRVGEIVWAGELGYVTRMDGYSLLFLAEMALMVGPALGFILWRRRAGPVFLATMATSVVLGGGLYRFSTFLFAYNPGPQWSYFPSLAEFMVTIGFISMEILGYVLMVKLFPILRGTGSEAGHDGPRPSPAVGEPAGAHPTPLPA
jgi:Ni/Fe-hydrogenase subunit HybB-like protein/Fe-S-cluster-containing dehydrogenase component